MDIKQFLTILREAIERMDVSDSVTVTPFRTALVVRIGTDSFTVKAFKGAEIADEEYDDVN